MESLWCMILNLFLKRKIFIFVMVFNIFCILFFMIVCYNKVVLIYYEIDYVYCYKCEFLFVVNWLQFLFNDQWGFKFEYIFYKQWYIFYKYRNIVVGVFFKGVEVFGIILLRFDEIEFIYLK